MPFHKMLQKIIAEQELQNFEIVKLVNEKYKIALSENHFSRVLHGHKKAFKAETIKAIAEICKADERLLIIEAYFDNAPEEIKNTFIKMKTSMSYFISNFVKNSFTREVYQKVELSLKKETMAEFIISILDLPSEADIFGINQFVFKDQYGNLIFKNSSFYPVPDDGMKPIIRKDDQVCITVLDKYNNGDIVLLEDKKTSKQYIRQIYYLGNEINIMASNKEYNNKTVKKEYIKIIGKVTDKVTKIG